MQPSQFSYRKTYRSFLLSSLCHGLLLFLAFFSRYTQIDRPASEHHVPAQVRWKSSPNLPLHPQHVASQTLPVTRPAASPSEASPSIESIEIADLINANNESVPLKSEQIPASKEEPTKRSLTAAAFMDSFMTAAHELRKEKAEQQTASQENSQAAFIEREQKVWSQLHYKQRVIEAIGKASQFKSRKIHYNESIDTIAQLTVPILKDGSLGDMSQQTLSGIQEVDRYLIDVLRSADFPPIPKRFNTDIFIFTIPITISIKKGSNVYYLSVH